MKTIKVCLAWHSLNSANYGVSALAIAHLQMLVEAARKNRINLEIDTLGFPNNQGLSIRDYMQDELGVSITHHSVGLKIFLKDLLKMQFGQPFKSRKYDYVFDIGEGDSFADIYGLKRFFFSSITKYMAIKNGALLILAPQTIGPFKNRMLARFAKYLMNRSHSIYVRDFKSKSYLDSIEVPSTEVSDVAFLLPYKAEKRIADSVGLNVSGLLWNGGYTNNNQFGLKVDYHRFIRNVIDGFLKRGKSVHLIGHVLSVGDDDNKGVEDDYGVMRQLQMEYSDNPLVVLAPKFTSPIEAKSYISQMEFFIGSRMHATIGAISAGVATVPVAYSRKFSGVFGSIDYPYTQDAFGSLDTDTLLTNVFDLYDNKRELMAENAATSVEKAKQELNLYGDFLEQTLR